jgi:hypothetical protein
MIVMTLLITLPKIGGRKDKRICFLELVQRLDDVCVMEAVVCLSVDSVSKVALKVRLCRGASPEVEHVIAEVGQCDEQPAARSKYSKPLDKGGNWIIKVLKDMVRYQEVLRPIGIDSKTSAIYQVRHIYQGFSGKPKLRG